MITYARLHGYHLCSLAWLVIAFYVSVSDGSGWLCCLGLKGREDWVAIIGKNSTHIDCLVASVNYEYLFFGFTDPSRRINF